MTFPRLQGDSGYLEHIITGSWEWSKSRTCAKRTILILSEITGNEEIRVTYFIQTFISWMLIVAPWTYLVLHEYRRHESVLICQILAIFSSFSLKRMYLSANSGRALGLSSYQLLQSEKLHAEVDHLDIVINSSLLYLCYNCLT